MQKITVLGTGYVGLVTGAGISDFGHTVFCADVDQAKITALQKGRIPIYEPGLEELVQRNVKAGRLSFTTDVAAAVQQAQVVFIAVGTPQRDNGEADLRAVREVSRVIGENLNGYKVICTKSTVPIGTGDLISSIITKHAPQGMTFDYVSNPEFLREGAAVNDFTHPDRVVFGSTSTTALKILREVYRPLYINETPIIQTDVPTAEMIKYASNAFLALKISYINEIANLCEAVGADVHTVARAMGIDGRISPKFLHPGPGFGGSCFPKDTRALVSQGEQFGTEIGTVRAAIQTNQHQKYRMVAKLKTLLGGSFKDKTVAVLGLSFKPLTNDIRESPALPMLQTLLDEGASVRAYDPAGEENMRAVFPEVDYRRNWQEAVRDCDAMVIMTEWNEFRGMNLKELKTLLKTPLILDTRNILNMDELTELGFTFDNVGRPSTP